MEYGICTLATVPVRETPYNKSQMINQLLFGDLFKINDINGGWALITTTDDNYEGWVDVKQINKVSETWFQKAVNSQRNFVADYCGFIISGNKTKIPVTMGASIPLLDNTEFSIENDKFTFEGRTLENTSKVTKENIIKTAKLYLKAPYLWGGRSPFGIDCSGFSQMVFKINGILLPRDSSQQINIGKEISFIEEAGTGDLAFFDNDEGNIVHVGILIDNKTIIHASGEVRIDKIDHFGIFNEETGNYSHKLRVIKRIF